MSKPKEFIQSTIPWAKKKPKLDAEGKEVVVEGKEEKKSLVTTGEYGSLELGLTPAWREIFKGEFTKEYWGKLIGSLNVQHSAGKQIFPPKPLIFEAFNCCPMAKIKVVILGQDPFFTPKCATGLSFSVPPTEPIPPSLVTIFRELKSDMTATKTGPTTSPDAKEFKPATNGCLRRWADQGVLLLNSTLTVNEGEPNSHESFGWSQFTDAVVKYLSSQGNQIVFLLWGSVAQRKASGVIQKKHCVLKAPHPSPNSPGVFLGCKHFSKANTYLKSVGKDPIVW